MVDVFFISCQTDEGCKGLQEFGMHLCINSQCISHDYFLEDHMIPLTVPTTVTTTKASVRVQTAVIASPTDSVTTTVTTTKASVRVQTM